jgi:hypothetical protein
VRIVGRREVKTKQNKKKFWLQGQGCKMELVGLYWVIIWDLIMIYRLKLGGEGIWAVNFGGERWVRNSGLICWAKKIDSESVFEGQAVNKEQWLCLGT